MQLAYITKSGPDLFLYTAEGKPIAKVINFKDDKEARRKLKAIAKEKKLSVTSQAKALESIK